MKILFGGSFDPIHSGHLYIIRKVIEEFNPQKFIIVPAGKSLTKINYAFPASIRLNLIQSALSELPGEITSCIDISHFELDRTEPVFAFETVMHLRPDTLLIGGDHDYMKWKNFEDIIYNMINKFLVYPRNGLPQKPRHIKEQILKLQSINISSYEILKKISSGLSVDDLVPKPVSEALKNFDVRKTLSGKEIKDKSKCIGEMKK